jgi:hypothetical protein
MKVTNIDTLNGSGMDVHGLLDIRLTGGRGNDTIWSHFASGDGLELDGNLLLRLDGGEGNDTFSVRLVNTVGSRGNYDVTVLGGGQDDTVSLFLEDRSLGKVSFNNTSTLEPSENILLDGGDGTLDQATVNVPLWAPVKKVNFEL